MSFYSTRKTAVSAQRITGPGLQIKAGEFAESALQADGEQASDAAGNHRHEAEIDLEKGIFRVTWVESKLYLTDVMVMAFSLAGYLNTLESGRPACETRFDSKGLAYLVVSGQETFRFSRPQYRTTAEHCGSTEDLEKNIETYRRFFDERLGIRL